MDIIGKDSRPPVSQTRQTKPIRQTKWTRKTKRPERRKDETKETYNFMDVPPSYDYRLKDQSIGAAISVMGNIPEGFVRLSNREFI